jgi:hypothetical protein
MERKRSGWVTFLMYLAIGIFSAVIIYSIVTNFTSKYSQINSGSLIQLAYDDTDNRTVTDAEIVKNGDSATVNLAVKNTESGSTNYYTVTCDASLVYDVHSFDGLNTKNVSVFMIRYLIKLKLIMVPITIHIGTVISILKTSS